MSLILKIVIKPYYSLMVTGKANQVKVNQNRLKIRNKSFTFLQQSIHTKKILKLLSLIKYFKCLINRKLINKNSTSSPFVITQISMISFLKTSGNQRIVNKYIKAMATTYTNSKTRANNKMYKWRMTQKLMTLIILITK